MKLRLTPVEKLAQADRVRVLTHRGEIPERVIEHDQHAGIDEVAQKVQQRLSRRIVRERRESRKPRPCRRDWESVETQVEEAATEWNRPLEGERSAIGGEPLLQFEAGGEIVVVRQRDDRPQA